MKKGMPRSLPLKLVYELKTPRVSAASGLIQVRGRFYVIADDELSLFSFSKLNPRKNSKLKLFPGALSIEKKKRKSEKPDLESLVYIPSTREILCIPSGSKKNRTRGARISKNNKVLEVDFKKLYRKLKKEFRELNIEGAVFVRGYLRLFQRGNGKRVENATIDIECDLKGKSLFTKDPVIRKIREYDLGDLDGVPYSFTDAAATGSVIWFLAVAENTSDPVLDGEVFGSILGQMSFEGKILSTHTLLLQGKPEGLCVSGRNFYIVTDDDDREIPARLFRGMLPG